MSVPSTSLFNTIPSKDDLGFQKSGSPDYASIANFLEFKKVEVSKIADVAVKSVIYDQRIPDQVREHLDQIAILYLA